jgi:RES domain-containing protein
MVKKRHVNDLSGKGAELAGGRWNQNGFPALYLAENISLTIIETIVHCNRLDDLNNRLVLSIKIPDDYIDIFDIKKLPKDWNSYPYNNFTIEEGTKWLISFNNLILKIPSAVIPEENIFLINPRHSETGKIEIINKQYFKPDHRLAIK